MLFAAGSALAQEIEEYRLKAAVLYNFAKFVEWPKESFSNLRDPIVSCIMGQSPVGVALEREAGGKMIDERKFIIRNVSDLHHLAGCQILFVSSSERNRLRSILDEVAGRGVLTVGETDGFASRGGVVNFKLAGNKIRIQINVEAAQRERLRISSRLLSLAELVRN
jgi:hypothetical protein